ncbi:MAG: hypothetical protein V4510_00710 [bacterium]
MPVKADDWGRAVEKPWLRLTRVVLPIVGATLIFGFAAILVGRDEHFSAGLQAVGTFGALIVAVLLYQVTSRQQELLKRQATLMAKQQNLLEMQDKRDRAVFEIAEIRGNPFLRLQGGEVKEVDFDILNSGHKDSAVLWVKVVPMAGEGDLPPWEVQSIQRHFPGKDSNDMLIRAGDRVRLRGNVVVPTGIWLGEKYRLEVRPVLHDGTNGARLFFPPYIL